MSHHDTDSYNIRAILNEMQNEYSRSLEEGEETQIIEQHDFVLFRLGGENFALASNYAKEVLRLPRLVPIPRLPTQIAGIFNLRGQILAITDLRPFLALPPAAIPPRAQALVVEAAGFTTALLTDGVIGIRSLPVAEIEPLAEGLTGFPREAAIGQISIDSGLLVLLDLERILSRPEFTIDQKASSD